MDFTREPIIETIITPREGCKLVVRNSKAGGQEEYFVDAVEVVSFGNSFFFRSLERPKSFLVPASDYEVLEAREARMVLKNVGLEKGSRSPKSNKSSKQPAPEKESSKGNQDTAEAKGEARFDKKRDRRRNYRRRRGKEEGTEEPTEKVTLPFPVPEESEEVTNLSGSVVSGLLPPPPSLISDSISKYKETEEVVGDPPSEPALELPEEPSAPEVEEDVSTEVVEAVEEIAISTEDDQGEK